MNTITKLNDSGICFVDGLDLNNPDPILLQNIINNLANYESMYVFITEQYEKGLKEGMKEDVRDVYETVFYLSPNYLSSK